MHVLIVHDEVAAEARPDESDALVQAALIERVLRARGDSIEHLGATLDLRAVAQRAAQADLVFNLVESLNRRGALIHLVPALIEAMGVRMTGCPARAIAETSNKLSAKSIMHRAGIPTPGWVSIDGPDFEPGRWIVKSVWEHASVGLDDGAVVDVDSLDVLRTLIEARAPRLGGHAFAERFIEGREFNLSMLERDDAPIVLPHAEIRFEGFAANQLRIVGYAAKWAAESFEYNNTPRTFDFPRRDAPLLQQLSVLALRCWDAFGLRGYARVDFRVDSAGRPWVLEVNTNPCLSEDAGFMAAAERAGLSPVQVIDAIIAAARPHSGNLLSSSDATTPTSIT